VQVLREHRRRQAEERLRVGPERGTDDYVFTTAWANRSTPARGPLLSSPAKQKIFMRSPQLLHLLSTRL